ncbi:MAG TPA: M20 family peptidase [Gemmatimonadaceae bacterium]|nr:M20 family peptidase [Gemmatimonadaceae bacterium]
MQRLLLALFSAVAVLLGAMAVNAARTATPPAPDTAAIAIPPIDTAAAALHLAEAVRFPTVSLASGGPIDTVAFRALHQFLEQTFPAVHRTLSREVVGGLSLLYTWKGTDTTLAPVVLMGHFDVVPVPEPNLAAWEHPPFAGDTAGGFVWGRGTLDDKSTVVAVMEAVEGLLTNGFAPKRTVYLTFGHDEEVGGMYGAREIVKLLVARGVKPALVVDEGGFMGANMIPGIPQRVAIVGIAEKGYVSLRLTAVAEGGHSSMPGPRTAVGALARAIARLEAEPFPASLDGPTRGMIEAMAPHQSFRERLVSSNLWITAPLLTRVLQGNPMGAALLHTTVSPTMLDAGVKDNVLPPEASAVVNFRIRPGETVQTVMARVRDVVADSLVRVARLDSVGVDPSPVSSTDGPAYALITRAIAGMVPGTRVPVIPYLVMGGTDAKYWGPHSDRVYRFLPIPLGEGDRARVHGVNERVSAADFAASVGFFMRLIKGADSL